MVWCGVVCCGVNSLARFVGGAFVGIACTHPHTHVAHTTCVFQALDKWEGRWPLAERVWVKRQIEKLVFAMNQFVEEEVDLNAAKAIESIVVREEIPRSQQLFF
jgi:hypothetical protein